MKVDLHQSIEQLEQDYWSEPVPDSVLVRTCHDLRKKPLENFRTEDFRLLIGQNIGLHFLIPLALELLNHNILAEGDYYPGDLLESLLGTDQKYWKENKTDWNTLKTLYEQNEGILETTHSSKQIKKRFEKFEAINFS